MAKDLGEEFARLKEKQQLEFFHKYHVYKDKNSNKWYGIEEDKSPATQL
jgi:hypothetical protein